MVQSRASQSLKGNKKLHLPGNSFNAISPYLLEATSNILGVMPVVLLKQKHHLVLDSNLIGLMLYDAFSFILFNR
jgi:hypothetical protein